MEIKIDAKGKACPIPVIMAKKEIDEGSWDFAIEVDNKTAVENLTRLAKSNDYSVAVVESNSDYYLLRFVKTGEKVRTDSLAVRETGIKASDSVAMGDWAVFIGKEGVGDGDSELSATLMKMYLYTLKEGKDIPTYILFMNNGVKIPVSKGQEVDHLKELVERGTEILVCGACLKFYGLEDNLEVGIVSNMYDIVEAMNKVSKVITI